MTDVAGWARMATEVSVALGGLGDGRAVRERVRKLAAKFPSLPATWPPEADAYVRARVRAADAEEVMVVGATWRAIRIAHGPRDLCVPDLRFWPGLSRDADALRAAMRPVGTGPVVASVSFDRDGVRARCGVELALREAEGPVVLRLKAPVEGRWLDVRSVDGRLYRPVLLPGTWTPAGVRGFARAVSGAAPWRDDPFNPVVPPAGPYDRGQDLPLALAADDVVPTTGERRLAEASVGLADVVVIGGIVHRVTDEPTLVVATRETTGSSAPVLTWSTRSLTGMDDLGVNGPDRAVPQWAIGGSYVRIGGRNLPPDRDFGASQFPLTTREVADDVARGLNRHSTPALGVEVVEGFPLAQGDAAGDLVRRIRLATSGSESLGRLSRAAQGGDAAALAAEADRARQRAERSHDRQHALCASLAGALAKAWERGYAMPEVDEDAVLAP